MEGQQGCPMRMERPGVRLGHRLQALERAESDARRFEPGDGGTEGRTDRHG
jgi:hypothetical protein